MVKFEIISISLISSGGDRSDIQREKRQEALKIIRNSFTLLQNLK
jgi:hypothetical protein